MASITQIMGRTTLSILGYALASVAWAQPPAESPGPAAPSAVPRPEAPALPDTVDLEAVLRGSPRGMTADAAATRAVQTGPTIDVVRESVKQARAGADRAVYGFVPQLTTSASYTRLTPIENGKVLPAEAIPGVEQVSDPAAQQLWDALATAPFPIVLNQYQLLGTLAFPVTDMFLEVLPRWKAAKGMAQARKYQVRAESHQVALAAREAFYQFARARGALAVARIARDQARLRKHQVDAFAAVGDAGPADVKRIEAQVATARVAVVRAQAGVDIAAGALRTLLHVDNDYRIEVGEDVLGELPTNVGARDELIDRGVVRRPEASALRQLIGARGKDVAAAKGSRYPNLYVTGQAEYSNPMSRVFPQTDAWRFSANVGVMLEWSLHDTLNGGRDADAARASQGQAEADLRALEDAIRNQVTEAHIGYISAREALDAARVAVEAAEETMRVRMAQYGTGGALVTDLMDASLAQVRAQLSMVNAAIDARVALARLRRATGDDDPAVPN